jgi:hypothetical protein
VGVYIELYTLLESFQGVVHTIKKLETSHYDTGHDTGPRRLPPAPCSAPTLHHGHFMGHSVKIDLGPTPPPGSAPRHPRAPGAGKT